MDQPVGESIMTVESSSEPFASRLPAGGIGVAHRQQKRASFVLFAPQTSQSTVYNYPPPPIEKPQPRSRDSASAQHWTATSRQSPNGNLRGRRTGQDPA